MKKLNLKDMFDRQKRTDDLIRKNNDVDYDTVDLKIVAFKVEFGEFLNEYRFFKFWSKDQEPRTFEWYGRCKECNGAGVDDENYSCSSCAGTGDGHKNPLLEEFADCMAFIMAIALERGWVKFLHALDALEIAEPKGVTETMLALDIFKNDFSSAGRWLQGLTDLLQLAEMMGISAEEIQSAYIEKDEINRNRQATGY